MGVADVEAFLSMLAHERKVSASTHNQSLSALLFLYREVLSIDLPWLNNIGRPQQTKRIPSVLTKDEVAGLLAQMDGVTALLARLLYGTGLAFAAIGYRHSHGARVAGSFRRFDNDDLHPCAQGGRRGHGQPFGFTASGLSRHHNLTGIPRPAICCLACPTVNSP